jgi:hypothetical protein
MEWILDPKLEPERLKDQTPNPVLSSIHVSNHNQDFWGKKRFLIKTTIRGGLI